MRGWERSRESKREYDVDRVPVGVMAEMACYSAGKGVAFAQTVTLGGRLER